MPVEPIRNVVFDFGGVLVNWKPMDVVSEMFDDTGLRGSIMQSVFHHPDWLELDRGTFDEAEAVVRFAARTGVRRERIAELMARLRSALTLVPGMAALVRTLARHDVPVYGLSNMSVPTFALLKARYDIWSVFTGIVISGEVGMVKPEQRIFEHIVSTYGLEPAETMFVDDYERNVLAAEQAGFQTLLFEEPADCAETLLRRLSLPLKERL